MMSKGAAGTPVGAVGRVRPGPEHGAGQAGTPAGARPTVGPAPRMRRRPALIAVSLALVVVGALVSVWAYTSLGSSREVVAVRTDVAMGSVIARESLVMVRVGVDPALQVVPADRIDTVVGQRAAVDLRAGQLMVPAAVSDDVVPHRGNSVVGLSLGPGQLPGEPLRVGDRVRVVSTPGQQGDVVAADVGVFGGVVVGVTGEDPSGKSTVSVEVPEKQAPELAARSATGKIALVLDSRER